MLKDEIREDMNKALKTGDKETRVSLGMLLSALEAKEKEKKAPLTEAEEGEVVIKMAKQVEDSINQTPLDRAETLSKLSIELVLYKMYMPQQMTEDEIRKIITDVLAYDLGRLKPSKADKGAIMKHLMPKVKGKADGRLVNSIVDSICS